MTQGNLHAGCTVHRTIAVENPDAVNGLFELKRQLPGIQELVLDKPTGKLAVAYDSAVIAFSAILTQLSQAGIHPVDSRWFRLKAAWYDYTDRNAADQAHARPKACCNKAPRA